MEPHINTPETAAAFVLAVLVLFVFLVFNTGNGYLATIDLAGMAVINMYIWLGMPVL